MHLHRSQGKTGTDSSPTGGLGSRAWNQEQERNCGNCRSSGGPTPKEQSRPLSWPETSFLGSADSRPSTNISWPSVRLRVRRWESQEIWVIENTMPHIPPCSSRTTGFTYGRTMASLPVSARNRETSLESPGRRSQRYLLRFPVRAGNAIFCVSAFGQVVAIEDGDEFKQLGVTDLNQVCRSTPALANGDLYLRTGDRLICIKGK